jgi:lipopolysaccharide transport system ATP-binding protein
MSNTVIEINDLGKLYRLGQIGSSTLSDELKRWWWRFRGKEDLFLKMGEVNDRTSKGKSDYVWALKDINFSVEQGDVLGIIGKNGAGKSTLLKILSRTTTPTTGEYKIKGRVASLLEVGTGFHPDLTGRENVFLNGAILGMTRAEIRAKFDEIVAFSGVERYVDTPVKRYSSGMYIRLAFAVAAHLESEILIIDEVLSVGDAEFQKKCLGKMKDISKQGRTVLFVSHNMPSIRALCNKAVLLQNGNLTGHGSIQEIIAKYFNNGQSEKELISGLIPENISLYNSGEGRFTFANVMNGEGIYQRNLSFKEKFALHFSFMAHKDLNDVSLSIFIVNSYGENILMVNESETYKPQNYNAGINEFKVMFDIELMPGDYSIGLALSHYHSGSSIDHIESICDFKVAKETKNKDFEYPWATVHGYILPKVTWKKLN